MDIHLWTHFKRHSELLQLGDRTHLKKELTKLQFIGGSEDFKIEPLDTLNTLCLPHRHKK
jgi:hypothetical protein